MHTWISLMAGGPQDGERFTRVFDVPRCQPPALRASDGKACCPVAMRPVDPVTAVSVVVHPDACEADIERAIDAMIDAAKPKVISGK